MKGITRLTVPVTNKITSESKKLQSLNKLFILQHLDWINTVYIFFSIPDILMNFNLELCAMF